MIGMMVMAAALQKAKEAVKKERQLEKLHQQLQKGTPRNDGLAFSTCLQLALMHEAAGLPNEALRIYQALLKNKASPQVSLPDPCTEFPQQQVALPLPKSGLINLLGLVTSLVPCQQRAPRCCARPYMQPSGPCRVNRRAVQGCLSSQEQHPDHGDCSCPGGVHSILMEMP